MYILLILVIIFCFVNGSQKTTDGLNDTALPNGNFRQKMSPELDEIDSDRYYTNKETKGGTLQRLLSSVTFVCKGRFEGYYADTDFECQTFHYCKQNGLRFTFVCPPDSIFNQKEMMCDHNISEPHNICIESNNHYYLNAVLYAQKKDAINDTDLTSAAYNHSSKIWSHFQKTDKKEANDVKNNSKQTEDLILPFKGFISLKQKNNQSAEKLLQMSPIGLNSNNNSAQNGIKWMTNSDINFDINSEQYSNKSIPTKIKTISSEKSTAMPINDFKVSISPSNNSIESTNPFSSNISDLIDWDDVESGIKLDKPPDYFHYRPNFNEMVNPVNLINYAATAPIPLPAVPVPLMKPGPLVMLRPNYIPGTLPIATLYKQTEYMFGKPHVIHKGLYLNPNFGAAIVDSQPIAGPPPFVSSIGLIPTPSDRLNPKMYPKNPKILTNLHNALTKFSLNDIFNLKGIPLHQMNPKRKGSDKSNNSVLKMAKMPVKPLFDKMNFNQRLENHFYNNRLFINERLSNEEMPPRTNNNPYFGDHIQKEKLFSLNGKPDIKELNKNLNLNEPKFKIKTNSEKYSLKIEDTLNSKHIITQPSVFTNINSDKRKKWIENYAKIKKKYIEREKKSQQNIKKNSTKKKFTNI